MDVARDGVAAAVEGKPSLGPACRTCEVVGGEVRSPGDLKGLAPLDCEAERRAFVVLVPSESSLHVHVLARLMHIFLKLRMLPKVGRRKCKFHLLILLGRTTSLSWDSCWKPSSVHTLHFWQILNGSLLVHPLRLHAVFLHLHAVRHPCVAVYLSSSGPPHLPMLPKQEVLQTTQHIEPPGAECRHSSTGLVANVYDVVHPCPHLGPCCPAACWKARMAKMHIVCSRLQIGAEPKTSQTRARNPLLGKP